MPAIQEVMPKSTIRRAVLRALVLAVFLAGAVLVMRALPFQGRAPPGTAAASQPPSATGVPTSAAIRTPARLAATAAAAAASAAAVAPSKLSTIRVIVSRHDTLDHIFRRLELSLSDLASLRSLPGIRHTTAFMPKSPAS